MMPWHGNRATRLNMMMQLGMVTKLALQRNRLKRLAKAWHVVFPSTVDGWVVPLMLERVFVAHMI